MNEKIKKLKEIIDGTDNQIFEAQMDYTARNMIFRRKPSSATPFS